MKNQANKGSNHAPGCQTDKDFRELSHWILHSANHAVPIMEFLKELSKKLVDFSGCDRLRLILGDGDKCTQCEAGRDSDGSLRFESASISREESGLKRLYRSMLNGHNDSPLPPLTKNGGYWTGSATSSSMHLDEEADAALRGLDHGESCRSLALIPLSVGDEIIGLLQLISARENYFSQEDIVLYEDVAQSLGGALAHQRAQAALRERVKELTCLYGIAQMIERPGISLEEILQGIVELLPPAWQYPEITHGRIVLDACSYSTKGFKEGGGKQSTDIVVNGERRGVVEVFYEEEMPELDEGPFLKEERSLINAITREVAVIIERREAEADKSQLQDQLRHADRLATIGQLAAGVAHELNEPLGNILGFAQLTKKCPGLPEQAEKDVDKVVEASLHAREVIKKLMVFARQMPPKKTLVNLNKLAEDGLYFLEFRCIKAGIELIRSLSPDIPEITADPSQLHQALVNLVVNSIQAMPEGGRLTVQTLVREESIVLMVEDTGIGMSEELKRQIFIPFFTTKDVNQGTGLGLAVVHGIITSHGGSIHVQSEVGRGSRFEIRLPVSEPKGEEESR